MIDEAALFKEMRQERERLIAIHIRPAAQFALSRFGGSWFGESTSAIFSVAQFFDDEAKDAVHADLMVVPALVESAEDAELWLKVRDRAVTVIGELATEASTSRQLHATRRLSAWFEESVAPAADTALHWPVHSNAIQPFAPYCREGADQEMALHEAFAPYAIFFGDGTERNVSVCHRPHLRLVPPRSHWGAQ